jgi:hypothetical protein
MDKNKKEIDHVMESNSPKDTKTSVDAGPVAANVSNDIVGTPN